MYETRDCYILYSRFLEQEGYDPLPRVPLEKRKLKFEDVYPILYLKYSSVPLQKITTASSML